ncbi:27525_t:CDS:2, partial [Gigaspora margarita]
KDIIRHTFAERIIHHANKIVGFFKKSYKAAAILNQKILLYQISGGEEIQENHSEIISSVILTILCGRGFFTNLQYFLNILLPIKEAIIAVEANCSTLSDCYINLVKIAAAIQNLSVDEYKGF